MSRKVTVMVRIEVEADGDMAVAPLVAHALRDFAAREDVSSGSWPHSMESRMATEGAEVRLAAAWNVERKDASTGDEVHIEHPHTMH